jgi:D-beta-D-heptose 7-phosphate kinase/D-beta-D-heptose 1-phosphate adenosyltransferase
MPAMTPAEHAAASALLGKMEGLPILVLGDVMLDRYLWGDTARISPEAPVPVIEAREETLRLGGAANVARNIRALGGRPWLVGVVGDDPFAGELRREIAANGIAADRIFPDPARRTTTKTRVIARHQQVVRIDREDAREIEGSVLAGVRDAALDALRGAAGVVISDYGKGVIVAELLAELLGAARAAGVPVCVDPKETHFFAYRGATVLTPNLQEAGIAFGRRIKDDASLSEAGRALLGKLEARSLLVTQGEHGMTLFEADGTRTHYPAVATEVFDVTGAGDTVVSAFTMAAAAGGALRDAALLANHAAGVVVREVGTACASREEIRASLATHASGA